MKIYFIWTLFWEFIIKFVNESYSMKQLHFYTNHISEFCVCTRFDVQWISYYRFAVIKVEKYQSRFFFFPLEANITAPKCTELMGSGRGIVISSPVSTLMSSPLHTKLKISSSPSSFWLSEISLESLILWSPLFSGVPTTGIDFFSSVLLYFHISEIWRGWSGKSSLDGGKVCVFLTLLLKAGTVK